jgi:hypothetical protein
VGERAADHLVFLTDIRDRAAINVVREKVLRRGPPGQHLGRGQGPGSGPS